MTTALDRKLRGLKVTKRSILTSFSAITSFANNFETERDLVEVPVRLENINALWKEYNKVQHELEILEDSEEELEALIKERAEVEKAYYRTKGTLMTHDRSSFVAQNQPRSQETSNRTPQVKLPDVKLPMFGGEFETWLNFHDMFMSLVHTSAHLSTIQKFYYLRSSLTGEALKLIQTIPISAEQYLVAWKMLEDHYSNPRRLQKAYIQTLFEFPSMKQESALDLHSLIERFEANVKILGQLGEETEHWDALLIHLLSTRLDPVTRRDWEVFAEANKATKFKKLVSFLQERVSVLQTVANVSANPQSQSAASKRTTTRSAYHGSAQRTPQQCVVCSNHHSLYQCGTFSGMTIEENQGFVRNNHLCWNCLRRGHSSRECNSQSSCRQCGGRHHTLLCSSSNPAPGCSNQPSIQADQSLLQGSHNQAQPPSSTGASYTGVASSGANETRRDTVMLATAIINLVDDNGTEHAVRALLDSGSELCFATERLRERLKVQGTRTTLPIAGIGEAVSEVRIKFRSTVRSRVTNYSTKIDFHVMPKVTVDLPTRSVDTSGWPLPTGLKLADPSFSTSGPIDVVLGAEVFFDLFEASGRISLGDSLPCMVNSKLGWIVSGKSPTANNATSSSCNTATIAPSHQKPSRIPLRREVQRRSEDLLQTRKEKTTNDQPNQQKSKIYGNHHRTSAAQSRTEHLNNRFENFFATFQ